MYTPNFSFKLFQNISYLQKNEFIGIQMAPDISRKSKGL